MPVTSTFNKDNGPLLPRPLQPGDTLGLFSPAGPVRDISRLEAGITALEEMGFRIKTGSFQITTGSALTSHIAEQDYLAASDQQRAEELHTLWMDDEVQALMAVRGGYGCLRLLDRLDFSIFQARPKWLIGFSDLTVLLAANYTTAQLIGLHGPVITSLAECDPAARACLARLLQGDFRPYDLGNTIRVLRPGHGRGRLVVGNLTTLCHLIGTPWDVDLTGAILVLEDTGEAMYRLDRLLTHLALAGRLEKLAGLILGTFDCGPLLSAEDPLRQQLISRVEALTSRYSYPLWSDFPLGHRGQNLAIPYGMEAEMDSNGVLSPVVDG